ncbi:choice-of-anchor U domain-containing protein [Desulfatibacillum aliphaticivorans]|uniref:choice-of-anchor U domain-containing protein n=1 Tax=Desulfatibacillum aliphaticivorans TaxID=218208 RepID=UPI000408D2FA|nr:WD40 repeat domain-containing protein [Desulfatibacillum aliphaticivorans]
MKRLLIIAVLLAFVGAGNALAAWNYEDLPAFDPAPDAWNPSAVFVDNDVLTNTLLLYASGGKVYGWDPETLESQLVVSPTLQSTWAAGPAGMVLAYDGSTLYFHDNGGPTKYLYKFVFGNDPETYTTFNTNCEGSIYELAINPWTDRLWFVSGDYDTQKMYLYEIVGVGTKRTINLRMEIDNAMTDAGVGPIVFKGPNTVLVGEAVYATEGAFQWVYPEGDLVVDDQYAYFSGGLSDAVLGYSNRPFVATGSGQNVSYIYNGMVEQVLTHTETVGGLAFDGSQFYIGTTHVTSGTVSFGVLSDTENVNLVSPAEGYRYAPMDLPAVGLQAWNNSLAYYGDTILYAGDNGGTVDIYAYNTISGTCEMWADVDFSEGSDWAFGPAGLTAGSDGYLYYHDNGGPTKFLYRNKLSDPSVKKTLSLSGTIEGSIWDITWNPWSESLWIATADLDADVFYLYEVNQNFSGIVGDGISFPIPHAADGGASGPIIFGSEKYCYYGESVWGVNGYIHKVNVNTERVYKDVFTLTGGLNSAVYGPDQGVYVSTSEGNSIYKINTLDDSSELVAETAGSIADLANDGTSLIVAATDPATYATDLMTIWKPWLTGIPDDQAPTNDLDQTDFTVQTGTDSTDRVGIQGGAGTTIEYFQFLDPTDMDLPAGGPYNLRYGLLDFRAKVAEVGGTATIWIRFGENLAANRQWWKLDALRGWYQPENAEFMQAGDAVKLTIVDGGEGDADGVANGYVVDPAGPGYPAADDDDDTVIDDTSDCFVQTASQAHTGAMGLILLLGVGTAALLKIRFAARS